MNQSFYKEFECEAEDGSHYRMSFDKFSKPEDQYNRWRRMNIEKSSDGGRSWHPMPLTLSAASKVLLWVSAQPEWPPEIVVDFGCKNGAPWFEYEDDIDAQRWLRRPARWHAQFDNGTGKWKLGQIQVLTDSSSSA
jgi:hypothetical protein